jgi:hypothetical protein
MTSIHEQILQAQIARLEAELEQCHKGRESDLDELRRDWEVQLRTWAANALRQNSDYAASIFLKAAEEIAEVRAKGKKP